MDKTHYLIIVSVMVLMIIYVSGCKECQGASDCSEYTKCTVPTCPAEGEPNYEKRDAEGCYYAPKVCSDDDNACTKDECDSNTGNCNEPITCDNTAGCDVAPQCDTFTGCPTATGTGNPEDLEECDDPNRFSDEACTFAPGNPGPHAPADHTIDHDSVTYWKCTQHYKNDCQYYWVYTDSYCFQHGRPMCKIDEEKKGQYTMAIACRENR